MENKIAIVTGVIGAVVSYIFDLIGVAVSVLLMVMILDMLTYFMADFKNNSISVNRLKQEAIIKLYVIVLIGAVYIIDYSAYHYTEFDIFGGSLGNGAAFAYIAIEFMSIVENGIKMNAPISPYIEKIVNVLKEKFGVKEGER